jgi:urease accessory protein
VTLNGWRAELDIRFEFSGGLTRLVRRRHIGPLAVQRAFHPEADGSAHVYLLHPPGGIAGADLLDIRCNVAEGARAVLTTPGATKFYRSDHAAAEQRITIDVGPGGVCEYLPQETILFRGTDASMTTRIMLAEDAVYLGWDFVCFGRPAAGEDFTRGRARQKLEILRSGRPIWVERLAVDGETGLSVEPFMFAGKPIVGTLVYAGPIVENAVDRVRSAIGAAADGVFSASQLERTIVCRYLGNRMSEAKALFLQAWDVLRDAGLGKGAIAPRVWAT